MNDAPQVRFDLKERGGQFDLAPTEVRPWLDKESTFWGWLKGASTEPAPQVSNAYRGKLKSFRGAIEDDLKQAEASPAQSVSDALARRIENEFARHQLIASTTLKAKFVAQLAQQDQMAAIGALAYFAEMPVVNLNSKIVKGLFEAFAFEKGSETTKETAGLALEQLRQDWQSKAVKTDNECRAILAKISEDRTLAANQMNEFRESVKETLASADSKLSEFQTGWKNEFENTTQAYDQKLALQAPVSYWTAKRKIHHARAKSAMKLVAAFFVTAFAAIGWFAVETLSTEASNALKVPMWHFAVFGTMLGMLIWGARLLVRRMLSEIHLEADAHERITIANTYLALLRSGRIKDEHQKEVLGALIRHSPDGIVADDALPYFADLIAKRVAGKE